ncbi:MAG: hypothetical protein ABFR62_06395 [Bacteroidota bacterium]
MKTIINKSRYIITAALFILFSVQSFGQSDKIKIKSKFSYRKLNTGDREIKATFRYRDDKGSHPVPNITVEFGAKNDSTEISLAKIESDKEGIAVLRIENGFKIPMNNEGKMEFLLKFEGNDRFKNLIDDVSVIESYLKTELDTSKNQKKVIATLTDINGNPIEKTKVGLYVKRMHSLLDLGKEKTNEVGKVELTVPDDIAGNKDGAITLVTMVDKDRKYGSVIVKDDVKWGIPTNFVVDKEERNLWTQAAPIWMQVAVFTVFLVIISFFMVAMYNIYLMAKDK